MKENNNRHDTRQTASAYYASPIGRIWMEADDVGLCALRFLQEEDGQEGNEDKSGDGCAVIQEAVRWLDLYFRGGIPYSDPPLHLRGTPFQRSVWKIVSEIPYGYTRSYGEIARILEEKFLKEEGVRKTVSPLAVGRAVGKNPVLILLPCHRVIGSDGRLKGYAGGLERKEALLSLEGNFTSKGT